MRYQKLGTIAKRQRLQLYKYMFDESLLQNGITEVFVIKKPKKSNRNRTNQAYSEHKPDTSPAPSTSGLNPVDLDAQDYIPGLLPEADPHDRYKS